MDIHTKAKSHALEDLIQLMEDRMVGGLKSKSPKFAKVEVAAKNPEDLKDGLQKAEDLLEDPSKEFSKEDMKEDLSEGENPLDEKDHGDKDDLERLMSLYKQLK